jgi:hypothetical protein
MMANEGPPTLEEIAQVFADAFTPQELLIFLRDLYEKAETDEERATWAEGITVFWQSVDEHTQ